MNSKERLNTSWSFKEPDRVPIELHLHPKAYDFPEAKTIREFIENKADNFYYADDRELGSIVDFGFAGLISKYSEQIIEKVDNEYYRLLRLYKTPVGNFSAITRHNYDEFIDEDFIWERRYIETIEDLERLADAKRELPPINQEKYHNAVSKIGERGILLIELWHPLGWLMRNAKMEEVYTWFLNYPQIMHRYLEKTNTQVVQTIDSLGIAGLASHFNVTAHEMFMPPWMGPKQFDEFVFEYDKIVNGVIHHYDGKLRAHCHGNCMDYLEKMAEMGIDAVEPLEPPPFGNVDLAKAKELVGDRMLLSGNITSNSFLLMTKNEVRDQVRSAIQVAGFGGGFTLRTTGGDAATNSVKSKEQMMQVLKNVKAYVDAGLEFG